MRDVGFETFGKVWVLDGSENFPGAGVEQDNVSVVIGRKHSPIRAEAQVRVGLRICMIFEARRWRQARGIEHLQPVPGAASQPAAVRAHGQIAARFFKLGYWSDLLPFRGCVPAPEGLVRGTGEESFPIQAKCKTDDFVAVCAPGAGRLRLIPRGFPGVDLTAAPCARQEPFPVWTD